MDTYQHISIDEMNSFMAEGKKMAIVDIRDLHSFTDAHIENSIHLTDSTLGAFMQRTAFETPVVVVCYHGKSSQGAAQYLVEQGFEEVYSLDGGFKAWRRECAYVSY